MKIFVAPPLSVETEISSAAISHSRRRAAAECKTGTETFARTEETIRASVNVHVPLSTSGKRNPLKKAPGLNKAFFSALYR